MLVRAYCGRTQQLSIMRHHANIDDNNNIKTHIKMTKFWRTHALKPRLTFEQEDMWTPYACIVSVFQFT